MKRAITAAVAVVAMLTTGGILGRGRAEPPAVVIAPSDTLLAPGGPGGLDGIIDSLQARLAVRPDDWRGFASLGLAYLQHGRLSADPAYYPKADSALRRSLALRPEENFDATLGLGALSLGRHRFDAALDWGHRARRLNPQSAEAVGVIGDALLELGRYRAAARSYQAMIDLRPELASYARVSHYRELRGDLPGAIRAMALALDSAGTPEDAAWAAYQLGELHLGGGKVRRAADAYRRGAALAPDAVLPIAGLAKVAAARGQLVRAARMLAREVARFPSPELVILLGDVYLAAGEHREARRQYSLVRAMARLYRAGGVDTDLEMALFAADHGDRPAAALRMARDAYRMRPSIHAADAVAWALHAAGRDGTARRYAREALRLGTRNALFHFHAGMIALDLDERAAVRHLRAALEINPHFSLVHAPRARRVLERLVP